MDTTLSHIVFMTIFFSLVTVGMVLVIMWGMSTVDPHFNAYGKENNEQRHSGEMCPEPLVLIDGAGDEAGVRKPGFIVGKPFGDRFFDHGIGILTRLDASNQRQVARLSNDLVLKEIALLIGCQAHTSR
jgi:hypothetical protein